MQQSIIEIPESEYSSPILEDLRLTNISNFIIHEACKTYFKNFNSKWIPASFINFYFEEYKRYSLLPNTFLTKFFEVYQDIDIPSLVDNYYHWHYSVIVAKKNTKTETLYLMQNSYYLNYDLHEPTVLGMFDQKLYGELGNFCEHFKNSDELVSVKENYEYYMLKKIVLQSKVKIEITPAQKEALEQEKINNTVLVGEQTEVPEQKGKVVKIFFPKLTLPSPYPILLDKSRINSEHRIKHILRADRQLDLICKYKFNGVKYTVAFIEKRKVAKKKTKRKFDFDF